MDIRDIFAIAWKRKGTFLLVALATVLAATAVALTRPKRYQAETTLAMTPNVTKGQGFVASDDLATLLSTYGAIASSRSNQSRAVQLLGHPLDADVTASTSAGTGVLQIMATSSDPRKAAAAAQALSTAFVQTIQNNGLLVVQQVDPPKIPTTPVQPRPPLIIATGLVLGVGLALALVLIIERWLSRVENAEDLGDLTAAPVVGRVPRARELRSGGRQLLAWHRSELISVQESIRALRTSLQFALDLSLDVLQITSSLPGEGKSMVAANLAVAVAGVGIPTLLVDADFWAPNQHLIFDVPNEEGLSTLMMSGGPGKAEIPSVATPYRNLFILPTGPAPPQPTETMHARFGDALARIRQEQLFVIVDSPPILPVSDSSLIAPEVDDVIMVVHTGRTRTNTLRQALTRLEMAKGRLIGVVLNQTEPAPVVAGYYGYHDLEASAATPAD